MDSTSGTGNDVPIAEPASGNGNGVGVGAGGKDIEPLPAIPVRCTDSENSIPEDCVAGRNDFLPEVEVFDRSGEGAWVRLPRMDAEAGYKLANPSRYVDPATGQVLIRFVNETPESNVGFSFSLALAGTVR